jgi:hypothetical protein
MRLPVEDWQFYVVSFAALFGVWVLVRTLLPRRSSSSPCPGCPTGRTPWRRRLTALTLRGRPSARPGPAGGPVKAPRRDPGRDA